MFDPFKDFEVLGYLRNVEKLKEPQEVKFQENLFFQANIEDALNLLSRVKGPIEYGHFKKVHRVLFGDFYPWAGSDRSELGVAPMVSKGAAVHFSHADEIERSMAWGLRIGNDPAKMAQSPGEVMGAFAWARPFLDGNGRTMILIHSELCKRAGIRINWPATNKIDYLNALTAELLEPRKNALDAYLRPFVIPASKSVHLLDDLKELPGLDGLEDHVQNTTDVAYGADDAEALRDYEEVKRKRGVLKT